MFSLLLNVSTYISLLCSAPSKHSFLLFCHHFLTILIFFKKITNRSFRFASPHLWNQHQLPVPLRQPTIISLLSHSPHFTHGSSCTSSSFLPSLTPSLFTLGSKPIFLQVFPTADFWYLTPGLLSRT